LRDHAVSAERMLLDFPVPAIRVEAEEGGEFSPAKTGFDADSTVVATDGVGADHGTEESET